MNLRRWGEAHRRQLVLNRLQTDDRRAQAATARTVRRQLNAKDVGQGVLLRQITVVRVIAFREPVIVPAHADRGIDT